MFPSLPATPAGYPRSPNLGGYVENAGRTVPPPGLRTGPSRPDATRGETAVTTVKLVARYARYLASSLAAIAFGFNNN